MRRFFASARMLMGAAGIVLMMVLVAPASEKGPDPSKSPSSAHISFQEIEHDFGKVGPDQTVKHTFKFKNSGKETLIIGDIKTTCGCTGTLLSQREIAAGGEGFIEISFHSGQSGGQKRKAIYVNSNDPQNKSIKLEIIANVIIPVELRPRSLYFEAERNERSLRTVELLYSSEVPLNIQALQSSSQAFAASYKPIVQGDQRGYRIDVKYDGSLPIGSFNERVTIVTDNSQYPKFDVILRGKVVGAVKVVPDAIALGVVTADQLPARTVRISNSNMKDFAVTGVKPTSPLIAYELSREAESNKFEIKISLTEEPPAGAFSERLSITTNDPASPLIEIPVFAYVKGGPPQESQRHE